MSQTVKFVRSDEQRVAVRADGLTFPLGQQVENVPEKTVKALQQLSGHDFEFKKESAGNG